MDSITSSTNHAIEACRWVAGNKETFRRLLTLVELERLAGNPCVRRGDIAKIALMRGYTISDVDGLRFDHNLWAALSRYMVMIRPHLSDCLHFRRSGLDNVDMVKIWRDVVQDDTEFQAASWRDAKIKASV